MRVDLTLRHRPQTPLDAVEILRINTYGMVHDTMNDKPRDSGCPVEVEQYPSKQALPTSVTMVTIHGNYE